MKYAVVILALVAAANAQFGNSGQYSAGKYNPYNPFSRNQYRYKPAYSTPAPFRFQSTAAPTVTIAPAPFAPTTPSPVSVAVPVAKVYSGDYNAEILRFGNENAPDGSYNYFYETSNGIAAQEQGTPRDFGGNPPVVPVVKQGSFAWTSPEGQPISISYIADENGYQASGNAIPTPHPIPAQIARALEYIARYAPQK